MIKSKLIRLEIGKTIDEIVKIFNVLQFQSGKSCGIDMINYNSSQLYARFIEEVVINEKQIDPFGNQIENKIIRFCVFEFSILELKQHQFLIKVDAPPRSLKSFTNILQSSLGFGVSIFSFSLDISTLISQLRDLSEFRNWQLKKARISGVKLSPTSVSKIEIHSQKDAYQDASSVLDLTNTKFEKVSYEIRRQDSLALLEITNTGLLLGDEPSINELLLFISKSLTI